jgi:hypothetical protein
MINNIKKIQRDIKSRKATKATNGMQLIANGIALLKKGFGLVFSEIFKKTKENDALHHHKK